jgi:N-acetyl-anhydromuramyl-L-alanine amidase AmpD
MTIQFLQARHFRPGPRARVDLVVIHSAEIAESFTGAEALMRACATQDRVASWHYAVDANSVTQSVREEDIAFHAPGANNNGVGIELTGRAAQSAAGWDDDFSRNTLELAAGLSAQICARWAIPVQFIDAAGLLAGQRGITTHRMVSQAFKKSTHTDPGPNFPMGRFLELVLLGATIAEPAPLPAAAVRPTLKRGSKGTAVVELQQRLNARGAEPLLKVDGDFGEKTDTAVRAFQQTHALNATGIVEQETWAALL